MQSKANKKGYYIVTQKRRLYTNYEQYIKITQEIFNETALRYFNLIFEHLEFLELSNQKCLRELEKLTLKSKNGIKPENYFDLDVPVYLRRAAINYAIGSAKTYQEKYKAYLETKDKNPNLKMPTKPSKFNASIVCYKGMYKDFAEGSLKVKLFNGKTWNWYKANIRDTNSKENNEILSPTIVLNKEYVMIHIPTKKEVKDVSPIKSRMYKKNIRVCGVAFSNSDSFAICVVIDKEKNIIKTKFIKGGNEYRKQTSIILKQIKKHRQNGANYGIKDHQRYWQKLNNISNWYAHEVSKQIVDFCKENKAEIISIADMNEDINIHFGKRVGKYSPIYLRRRITNYLNYKAFKDSIIVTKVKRNYIASKCYKCRANVKRKKLKYECENGHSGDYFFNSAMNIGIMCLKKFGI